MTSPTIDALLYALRPGPGSMIRPDVRRRIRVLDEEQFNYVCDALRARTIAKSWTPHEIERLETLWLMQRRASAS
jgi:hypothetical protein